MIQLLKISGPSDKASVTKQRLISRGISGSDYNFLRTFGKIRSDFNKNIAKPLQINVAITKQEPGGTWEKLVAKYIDCPRCKRSSTLYFFQGALSARVCEYHAHASEPILKLCGDAKLLGYTPEAISISPSLRECGDEGR